MLGWLDQQIVSRLVEGMAGLFAVESTYRTFIRSASLESLGGVATYRSVNLAVLEAGPVLAGLVAAGTTAVEMVRGKVDRVVPDSTDVLAVAMGLVLVLFYVPKLPVNVQVGARYLLPLYPLGLYLLARQSAVRDVLAARKQTGLWTYAAGVLVGFQLLVAYVVLRQLTVAEAAQDQAILGLFLAGILGVSLLASSVDDRFDAPAAMALGLTAAAGTAFVLLTGLVYFAPTGEHVLPVAEFVSDLIGLT